MLCGPANLPRSVLRLLRHNVYHDCCHERNYDNRCWQVDMARLPLSWAKPSQSPSHESHVTLSTHHVSKNEHRCSPRSDFLDFVGILGLTVHNIMLQSEWFRCGLVFCGGRDVPAVQLGLLHTHYKAGL